MRFSRLRKSRLTVALIATAWLPYVTVCCVVAPFEDSSASKPKCHILAGLLPASAEAATHSAYSDDSGHHGAHDEPRAHHGAAESSRDGFPAQTCCELTGKGDVTLEKPVDFGAQPVVVTVAFVVPEQAFSTRIVRSLARVDLHDNSPPLFLTNASFLI